MVVMDDQPGLRERKKQQTWGLIAKTAHRLFQEHGFDAVTVADVAREADVSRKTVFNYFPTKEDLFYSGLEFFEARLLEAIRERKPGESILAAFERFVTEPRGLLAADDPDAGERPLAVIRLITDSSALLAREQQIYAGYAAALAPVTGMIGGCCSSHASTTWLGVAPSSGGPGRAEVQKLPVFCRFLPGAARLGSGTLPHREAESHPCSARPPSPRRAAVLEATDLCSPAGDQGKEILFARRRSCL